MKTRSNEQPAAPRQPSAASPGLELPPELANHPKYRLIKLLGQGGMGAVYLGQDRMLERTVAIKVMAPELLGRPGALERFLQEAKSIANLPPHPNVVQVFTLDQAGPLHLMVMEYVQGIDLAKYVADKGVLPVRVACHLLRQAALGLQHAFEHGMVHRDVKPNNLIVTPKGQLKILDFGLAKLTRQTADAPGLTSDQAIMGTVDYMAPEQAVSARSVDIRADLYGLGCSAYYLLTGKPPFLGEDGNPLSVLVCHQTSPPPALQELRPDVPPELEAIIAKLLAKQPGDRFQTPSELASALAPLVKGASSAGAEGETVSVKQGSSSSAAMRPTVRDAATRESTGTVAAFERPPAVAPAQAQSKGRRSWLPIAGLGLFFVLGASTTGLVVNKFRQEPRQLASRPPADVPRAEPPAAPPPEKQAPPAPPREPPAPPSEKKPADPEEKKESSSNAGDSSKTPTDSTDRSRDDDAKKKQAAPPPPPIDPRTDRAKRRDRWFLHVPYENPDDYARKLEQLGAILVLATDSGQFLLIENFHRRPFKTTPKTLAELRGLAKLCTRVRQNDASSMQQLQLLAGLNKQPKYLAVFLPREAEPILLAAELAKSGKSEQQINDGYWRARFTLGKTDGKWESVSSEQFKAKDDGRGTGMDLAEEDDAGEDAHPGSPAGAEKARATLATLRAFDGHFADAQLFAVAQNLSRACGDDHEPLIAGLTDDCLAIQVASARALGELDSLDVRALPGLRAQLANPSKKIALNAMATLGKFGPASGDAAVEMGHHFFGNDPELSRAAGAALATMGPRAAGVLGEGLQQKRTRLQALDGLARLGADAKPLLKDVRPLAGDADASVRLLALRVLHHADDEFARGHLLAFLKDPMASVRHEAIRAASESRNLPKEVIEELGKLLRQEKGETRTLVAAALVHQEAAALPLLMKALRDEDFNVRSLAIESVSNLGPHAAPAVKELTLHLAGNENQMRIKVMKVFAKLGPLAKEAVPVLEKIARDDDYPEVRKAAREALKAIQQ